MPLGPRSSRKSLSRSAKGTISQPRALVRVWSPDRVHHHHQQLLSGLSSSSREQRSLIRAVLRKKLKEAIYGKREKARFANDQVEPTPDHTPPRLHDSSCRPRHAPPSSSILASQIDIVYLSFTIAKTIYSRRQTTCFLFSSLHPFFLSFVVSWTHTHSHVPLLHSSPRLLLLLPWQVTAYAALSL